MTAYATRTDLDKQFGAEQVTTAADRDGNGVVDPDVITGALNDATEEINSYVGKVHDLPLVTTPAILVRVCCDVAMYRLSIDGASMTEGKDKRYKDWITWLTNIAKGVVSLGIDEPTNVAALPVITTSDTDRMFTRSSLRRLL